MKRTGGSGVWLASLVLCGCAGGIDVTGHYQADLGMAGAGKTDAGARLDATATQSAAGEATVDSDARAGSAEPTANLRVTLDVRKDQTFTMRIVRGTEGSWSQTGTWVLRAGSLWMTAKGDDGNPRTLECPLQADGSFVIEDGRQRLVMRPVRDPARDSAAPEEDR